MGMLPTGSMLAPVGAKVLRHQQPGHDGRALHEPGAVRDEDAEVRAGLPGPPLPAVAAGFGVVAVPHVDHGHEPTCVSPGLKVGDDSMPHGRMENGLASDFRSTLTSARNVEMPAGAR